MNIDAELEVLREEWQSGTTVSLDLRQKVARQSRLMRIAVVGDILVTVTIGGGVIAYAVRSTQPDAILLAIATWLFLAAAWSFSLTVNRGAWSPASMDMAAFLDLSVRRCRGRLTAVRFAAVLFVTEIVFCLGWIYNHSYRQQMPLLRWLLFSSASIDIVWLITLGFFAGLVWYRRRKRAELINLLDLQKQMEGTT